MSNNTKNTLADLETLLSTPEGTKLLGALAEEQKQKHPEPAKLSPLARCYIAEAVASMLKVPSLKLRPDYRVELLVRREKLLTASRATHSEAGALVAVAKAYAMEPENGLFDAQKLLQATQSQALWMAAVDTSRNDRTRDVYDELTHAEDLERGVDANNVGREGAPSGLDSASDNEDAIMGFAGEDSAPPLPTNDEILEALVDVNLWINTIASALTLLPLPYTVEAVGVNARGKKLYRDVENAREAIEIQQERNRLAMQKRNAQLAAEAIARNEATFDTALAMVA